MSPAFLRTPVVALLRSAVFSLLFLSSASAQDLPLVPRPIAYWPLTNDTLNVVADENHGQLLGEAGFQDNALSLNGTNACVSFGDALPPPDSFSVCLWIRPDRDDRLMRIMGKFQMAENQREWCVFLSDSNRVWAFVSDDGTADPGHAILKATRENALSPGEWHHLAVTWQAGGETAIYIDGEREPAVDGGEASLPARLGGTAALTLGAYDLPAVSDAEGATSEDPLTLTNAFQGAACHLLLFKGVLSPDDVGLLSSFGREQDLGDESLSDESLSKEGALEADVSSEESAPIDAQVLLNPETGLPMTNGVEGILATNEQAAVERASRVVHVNALLGRDEWTGRRATANRENGPKKTIRAGLAVDADHLVIHSGRYGENLNIAGRPIRVVIQGKVDLTGRRDPPPLQASMFPILPEDSTTNALATTIELGGAIP